MNMDLAAARTRSCRTGSVPDPPHSRQTKPSARNYFSLLRRSLEEPRIFIPVELREALKIQGGRMGGNSAYVKLQDQLLQSPPHLLLCKTTQQGINSHPLPLEPASLHFAASLRHGAGQQHTQGKGDTGEMLLAVLTGTYPVRSRSCSRHTRELSPPEEQAPLTTGQELHTGTFCLAPQQNTPHISQVKSSNTGPGSSTAQERFHSQAEFPKHELICDPHTARATKGVIDSTSHSLSG